MLQLGSRMELDDLRSFRSCVNPETKQDGSFVAEHRDEIGDVGVRGDGAAFGGEADYPPARNEVHECLGDASAYDQHRAINRFRRQLHVDNCPEFPVTPEHPIPDEVGKMIVWSAQTTRGGVSESRLIVSRRPSIWTRRRDRSTAVTRGHGTTGYLRPTNLRTATTT